MIALIIATIMGFHALTDALFKPAPRREMPSELREAAADCILTSNPKSCATYEAAKPLYPIRPQ